MPPMLPQEFRDDVVKIVLDRDTEVTIAQISKDFDIHIGTPNKGLRRAAAYLSQAHLPGKALLARKNTHR